MQPVTAQSSNLHSAYINAAPAFFSKLDSKKRVITEQQLLSRSHHLISPSKSSAACRPRSGLERLDDGPQLVLRSRPLLVCGAGHQQVRQVALQQEGTLSGGGHGAASVGQSPTSSCMRQPVAASRVHTALGVPTHARRCTCPRLRPGPTLVVKAARLWLPFCA